MNTNINIVMEKLQAVELALAAFVEYGNEDDRKHFLNSLLNSRFVKSYMGYSVALLKEEKRKLEAEEIRLLSASSVSAAGTGKLVW